MSAVVEKNTFSNEVVANEVVKTAPKIIKKSYVLNELDAMKKKLNFHRHLHNRNKADCYSHSHI
jgi:hypothetical protein